MEYVAAGDVAAEGVHMLSTGGMLKFAEQRGSERRQARRSWRPRSGCSHPLQMAAPDVEFIPANAEASCVFMKMITLPKLRDALREMKFEVRSTRDGGEGAGADRPDGRDRVVLDDRVSGR